MIRRRSDGNTNNMYKSPAVEVSVSVVLPTSITSFITAVDKALSPGSPGDCAERQVVDARVAGDEDAEAVAAASHAEVRPRLAIDDDVVDEVRWLLG